MKALSRFIERASLEDAEAEPTPVVDAVEPNVEPVGIDGVDTLVEETPAPDAINAELTEVSDIQESLENFGALVDAAIARGGMRPEEGVMFQASLEHFQRRLGMAKTKLGLEDFGGNMSRMSATTVSQEALADVVKEASKKIQELFAKLVAFIKESVADFKLKSSKVQAVVAQSQTIVAEVAKSDTATDSSKVSLTKVDTLTKKDVDEGYTTAIGTAKQLTKMLVDMRTSLKAYEMSMKTLIANSEDPSAVAEFTADLAEQWGPCPAILKFVNGALGKPRVLTHGVSAVYTEDDGDALFETQYDPSVKDGFDLEVTVASMGQLGGATSALNRAVDDMVKEYATTAEMLTKMLSTRPVANGREAQINLAQSQFNVVHAVKNEVFMVISVLTRARNQAGYVMLMGAIGLKEQKHDEK